MNAALPSSFFRQATPWLRGAGLGVALYLGFLSVWRLPCLGGSCDAVLHSRWATLLGIPVGFWGVALWLGTFVPGKRIRNSAHHFLALGSIGFVALQVFALGHVCPWCLAHAIVCWLAWPGREAPPRRVAWVAGLVLAAGLLGAQAHAHQASTPVTAPLEVVPLGFDWLGQGTRPAGAGPESAVVLSLTCPLCLDLLATLPAPAAAAPRLIFLTSEENRELTEIFVAAVLAHPAGVRESFPALAALLLTQRDLVLSQPAAAARWLIFAQPDAESLRAEARVRLAAQQTVLTRAGIVLTPLRVAPTGAVETLTRWP